MANVVLGVHTLIFAAFFAGAVASPFIAYWVPGIFANTSFLIGMGVLVVVLVFLWSVVGGCPFTFLENKLRAKEGKAPYGGPCIDTYAVKWFGLSLPLGLSSRLLYVLLALPVLSAGLAWLRV